MTEKNLALELLVKSGNPSGVEEISIRQKLDEPIKQFKVAEAGVYRELKFMQEAAEGGIDSERVKADLDHPWFKGYFSKTDNIELLRDLAEVLIDGTNAAMEGYAQITAIDVLGIDFVEQALKRNLGDKELDKKVRRLVANGYGLVLTDTYIDDEMAEHYNPILEKWKDLVDMEELIEESVTHAVRDFRSHGFDDGELDEGALAIVDKLVTRSDRGLVSKLLYDIAGGEEFYEALVQTGKIDRVAPKRDSTKPKELKAPNAKIKSAVVKFEKDRWPSIYGAQNLGEQTGEKGQTYVAQKMGEWFNKGRMRHILAVTNEESGVLYDEAVAKEEMTRGIEYAISEGKINRLEFALQLPPTLVDRDKGSIKDFVEAYEINQKNPVPEIIDY